MKFNLLFILVLLFWSPLKASKFEKSQIDTIFFGLKADGYCIKCNYLFNYYYRIAEKDTNNFYYLLFDGVSEKEYLDYLNSFGIKKLNKNFKVISDNDFYKLYEDKSIPGAPYIAFKRGNKLKFSKEISKVSRANAKRVFKELLVD